MFRDGSMLLAHPHLQFTHHLPYGAIVQETGVQFVVFSRSATAMEVLLYDRDSDREPADVIALDPQTDRWGDVWSVFVPGVSAGQLYHFRADGPHEPHKGHRFNSNARLIDPYARALAGDFQPVDDGVIRPPMCVVVDDYFDWEGDRHLRRKLTETVIYELHVRGFTRSSSSRVQRPGTYLGVIEKIPYLQSLGVTAVELMPVHEFPIKSCYGQKEDRPNYWGYDPLAWFAPHRGYASDRRPGAQVDEFKQMVCALHQAGIEVILDVVFNHTAEGNHLGPTLGFKGLENQVYYMLDQRGGYKNYSGCGNTVNGNHPVVRELIFNCLRHWVHNYHVDGFRFDLASILSRDRQGELVPNPPLVEMIAEDPMLADTKIIAEAWDAAGGYQVGSFADMRWAEWNGHYRDDLRRFWRGDPDTVGSLATRLAGSSDLYAPSGRQPNHSINFHTSHDGFPLNDLVSFNYKHNEANGEDNRDGDSNNYSYNYGEEGPTRKRKVREVRTRQIKNMLASLMLSQGTPMLLAGDECRRTQRGNNNAYCQDNDISWFDWKLTKKNAEMVRFVRSLIALRKSQPVLRRRDFLTGKPSAPGALPDAAWFDASGKPLDHANDWHATGQSLMFFQGAQPAEGNGSGPAQSVLILLHAGADPREFRLPHMSKPLKWRQAIDTAAASPDDIYPDLDGPTRKPGEAVTLVGRSLHCYVASKTNSG